MRLIHSKQINNSTVIVQDVDVAQKLWGKNIAALKSKTTHINPNLVARYQFNIPALLMNLHKEAFPSCEIFSVNKISFFLKLIRKIYLTAVNYLENHAVPEIFKAFKEVYQYYLHCEFCITTVHAYG